MIKIKNFITNNIVDETYNNNNLVYSFSIINDDYFVFHIYNPNNEYIKINDKNMPFFSKIAKMFFNKSEKNKGCFNHQHSDDSHLYNSNIEDILNNFLNIEYTFVLVKTNKFVPLSIFCCIKNYIYNVCTNFDSRGNGYMSKLLDHYFLLIKKDKLKNGIHKEIMLDVVFVNPDHENVRKYYEDNYNFKFLSESDSKVILKKII